MTTPTEIKAAERLLAADNTDVLKELDAVQDMVSKAIAYYAAARSKVNRLPIPNTGKLTLTIGQLLKDAHTDIQALMEEIEEF